jgi:hypothetical protein
MCVPLHYRWAQIAKHLPGRTDNEVKNFWNSTIKKKLISQAVGSLHPGNNKSLLPPTPQVKSCAVLHFAVPPPSCFLPSLYMWTVVSNSLASIIVSKNTASSLDRTS